MATKPTTKPRNSVAREVRVYWRGSGLLGPLAASATMLETNSSNKLSVVASFDGLVSEIALRLLRVRSHNIDSEIYRSLMRIAEHYRVDRIDMRKFSEDRSVAKLLNWWLRDEAIGMSSDIRNDQIPWVTARIFRGEAVRIESLADLPAEAVAGRAMMERDGVRAIMIVPTSVANNLYGALLFANYEEREWPDEFVSELTLLGDALAAAYERAQSHSSLWMSETRLRAVLENQTDFIFRWLPDGIRTWVNDKYCSFLGESRELLIGTNFLTQLEPAHRQGILDAVSAMTADNPTSTDEVQVTLPSGEIGWQRWTDKGIFDEAGNLIEIQSVGRDVSDRMHAEMALVESESRYRNLVENTTDWIWEMNLDLERTYSNRQLEVILGYTSDELQELPHAQLIYPDDRIAVAEKLADLIERKSSWDDWVIRYQHKDGSCRYLESKAKPVFDNDGNLCCFRGIDRDITDDVLSKQVIARNEQKYRTVVESANDAIWLFDGERFTDCNDMTLQILQCRRDQIVGKEPWAISPEFQPDGTSSKELAGAVVADAMQGIPRRFEWVHLRPDGTEVEMEISLTPIETTHDGSRILAVGRDISEYKRARRKIEHRANFQSLLAELSTELATSNALEVIEKIDRFLPGIGDRYGLSGIALWWISDGITKALGRATGWRSEQDSPLGHSDGADRNDAPWLVSELAMNNSVMIDAANYWPAAASADRASFENWGVSKLLAFPAQVRERVVGACIMVRSSSQNWSTEDIQELRLLGSTITGAYARCWAVEEMSRREQDLARSQEIAQVGNFSIVYDTPQSGFSLAGRVEASSQCRNLFGFAAGEETVALAVERIHPDDRERVLRTIDKGFSASARGQQAYRLVRPDGTTIHVNVRSEFDRDKSGRVIRFFGVAHDVTKQVESNKKIENALTEINKLKDQLQEENVFLREEIRAAHGFDKIVGDSRALNEALRLAEKVAPTDLSVLILGETGTGKELIARAVHRLSGRKDKTMVSVNCAALSKDLIESELFGHEKGAFTGAHTQRKGRFEIADGGTLFLDEIGELPGELQAKLLRVLQDGNFERLGGTETLSVDVRLIAATNKNLMRAVNTGEFRADLYYRISNFPVKLPPLRDRVEDIPLLAEFLVRKHARRMSKEIQSISARTLRYLSNREWPGNVRELEGLIQRALISTTGPVLDYVELQEAEPESPRLDASVAAPTPTDLRDAERLHILNVLTSTQWVIEGKNGAAKKMGIPPSTLRSLMERLRIKRPQ